MRPPICDFCHESFDSSKEGGLVRFADHEALPPEMTGHPNGLLWFCGDHLEAAKVLTNESSVSALEQLAKTGG